MTPASKTRLGPARLRGPRRHLLRAVSLLVAIALSLAGAEVAVRILGVDGPRHDTGSVPHAVWHHWHRPDETLDFHVAAEGYCRRCTFNEHGLRDSRPTPLAAPHGVWRIALLGDSFAEGLQVDEGETVARRLEAELREAGRPAEVLNFGCSGFSSTLEYLLLRERVGGFGPRTIVCLHHFSDMTEDWRLRPQARWEGGRLAAIPAAGGGSGRRARRLLEESQLFRAAAGAWGTRRPKPSAAGSLKDSYDAIVHEPYSPDDREAWDYSLWAVAEMLALCRASGREFLLVLIPLGPQVEAVEPSFARDTGLAYLNAGRRLEYTGYQDTVTAYCREKGVENLDLLPTFRAADPAGRSALYLPRDQHWTAAGHALAARAIADRLLSR